MIRVKGHALQHEGWPYGDDGVRLLQRWERGRGKCECGAMSDVFGHAAARQRWHRAHKDEVVYGQPNLVRG